MLSVLTYNIYLGRNLDQILEWIVSLPKEFDIICFQEFPKSQIKTLQEYLKHFDYDFQFATSFKRKGRDFGELTLTNKKKLSIIETNIITLGHSIVEKKVLGLRRERTSLITKLRYNNTTILLANTHLAAYTINAKRREQLSKVIEIIDVDKKNKDIPNIILGDFNYSSLFRQGKFLKFVANKGFLNAHTNITHNLFSLTTHQLDYILYKNCKISDIQIERLSFSDHFPTKFTLKINN